jgi:hypothetical protein
MTQGKNINVTATAKSSEKPITLWVEMVTIIIYNISYYLIEWDPLTQYKHDYPPKDIPKEANIDPRKLRQSHFIFGDDKNPYMTSTMIQNKDIENAGRCNPKLDEEVKNDLRKNHFVFGNSRPNFETTFRTEFYDKSNMLPKDDVNYKNIEKYLRGHNYEFGDDKPNYISETADRFQKPKIDPNNDKNKISTQKLQESHCVFGNSNIPWNTTQKRSYTPKVSDTDPYKKNLKTTNFRFGDDKPQFKSMHNEAYVEHPYQYKPVDKAHVNYLRGHHYQFGKSDLPSQLITQNQVDYKDPGIFGNNQRPLIDNTSLRKTHWTLGDGEPNIYNTTYNIVHTPKKGQNERPQNKPGSINLKGNNPMSYMSDYMENYIGKKATPLDNYNNKNRKSNFTLGDMKNDFNTTTGKAFQFDPEKAKNANSGLDKDLIKELKSTHYKLGYDNDIGMTTQKSDYIPYGLYDNTKRGNLTGNNFDLGDKYNNKFEGETIYQTDYVQKEIPNDGNDCWC